MGSVVVMEMQRLMMKGMMPCPPMIRVAAWMMSSPKFLLQIYPRGGVSVFFEAMCLGSPCRLREMNVFDEEVLLVGRTSGWYGQGPP